MSDRYSNSPALNLRPEASRIRRWLLAALLGMLLASLWLLSAAGRESAAQLLAVPALLIYASVCRNQRACTALAWQRGCWSLVRGSRSSRFQPTPRTRQWSWLVSLHYVELPAGGERRCWLFADGFTADEWRRLRVRLRLTAMQGEVVGL